MTIAMRVMNIEGALSSLARVDTTNASRKVIAAQLPSSFCGLAMEGIART